MGRKEQPQVEITDGLKIYHLEFMLPEATKELLHFPWAVRVKHELFQQ